MYRDGILVKKEMSRSVSISHHKSIKSIITKLMSTYAYQVQVLIVIM